MHPAGEISNLGKDRGQTKNLYLILKEPGRVIELTAPVERFRTQGYSRPGINR